MKPHIGARELTIRAAMANLCNLDGVILPEADTRISVLDRGFLFGDSIYEVVRTEGGVPFAWPEHFARLVTSAVAMRMPLDLEEATVARRVAETVRAADHGDSYVRLVVTRGVGEAPNIDLAYATGKLSWLLMVRKLPVMSGKSARLAVIDRLRNDRRALDPAIKSGNYLNSVLGLAEAKELGATDCVMLNTDGFVTEASTANVFARIDGSWCTPTLEAGILVGVTRRLLIDFLRGAGEDVVERDLTAHDLNTAEEIFLSSSLRDVGPVTHLNGRALHGGAEGPQTMGLLQRFREHSRTLLQQKYAPHWRALVG